MIALYLAAIVAANLMVTWLGAWWAPYNAFLFIGLDLTARDTLHDRWHHRGLIWKMALLIAAGGLISYLLNRNAGMIAVASTVAFTAASLVDAFAFSWIRAGQDDPATTTSYMVRVNGSNVPAAAVDSILFALIAFGTFGWLTFWLFLAKVAGGLVWSLILGRRRAPVGA